MKIEVEYIARYRKKGVVKRGDVWKPCPIREKGINLVENNRG